MPVFSGVNNVYIMKQYEKPAFVVVNDNVVAAVLNGGASACAGGQ